MPGIKPLRTAPKAKSHSPNILVTTEYSDGYKELCFQAWYEAGRPRGHNFVASMPEDENKRKPTSTLLNKWRRELDWEQRADEMDLAVRQQLTELAIQKKVEMYKYHADVAKSMIDSGVDYLEKHGIDTAGNAIRAIQQGIQIERESTGVGLAAIEVSKASDTKLIDIIRKLTRGLRPIDDPLDENTVEGEFIEEE